MASTAAKVDVTTKLTVSDLRKNNAAIVSTYARVPEKAEAIQFQGWDNAPAIINWMPGLYFVPAGYPHALRFSDEYVDVTGHDPAVKNNASEFLVFRGADGQDYRIDLGSYLIRTEKGALYFYPAAQFKEMYQESAIL